MPYKMIMCALLVTALAFVPGCNKKGGQSGGKKGSGIPELSKKTPTDTSDIFKEFYSDDTSGQGSSKKSSSKSKSKTQTFSPSSKTPSASASTPGEFQENGRYIVQVSCVKAKSFAEKVVSILKEKNFPAYIAEVQNPTPALTGTFYRIRIGGFGGFSSAKTFGDNTLVPGGYEYWIDKRSNDNTGLEGGGLGSGAAAASNQGSPSSSWSSPAPAAEPSSSSGFGQSDFNASSSAPAPTPMPGAQPAAVTPSASSPSNNVSVPAPSTPAPAVNLPAAAPAATPATKNPASPSRPAQSPAKGNAPASSAPEASDWGADSSAASSSSGW
jgi:hypothetical protein